MKEQYMKAVEKIRGEFKNKDALHNSSNYIHIIFLIKTGFMFFKKKNMSSNKLFNY